MQNRFSKLVNIVEKLRGKGGCAWDKKQTLQSIRENIIEEAYETVEAINKKDYHLIKEEAGDLLLQAVFISQIANEKNKFNMTDVVEEVTEKLIRRHPHVFENVKVNGQDQILHNWEKIKRSEKGKKEHDSILSDIPESLPALIKAKKVQSKVERFGFKWDSIKYPIKKLKEELNEFICNIKNKRSQSEIEEEFGDIIFTLVNIGRFYNISPEAALNKTINKFKKRFNYIEDKVKAENKDMIKMNVSELEALWKEAKGNNKYRKTGRY